jgi:hypothetical protein
MSKSYEDENKDIQAALLHYESNPELKFKKLAEIYTVPYHRPLARSNGRLCFLTLLTRCNLSTSPISSLESTPHVWTPEAYP